ncbi:MAG: hypothetical protein LBM93_09115 [Oscillospiraceae bacterium]|jgi:hypothetical protein|nr:hypothetical protein [Oscillospiraceae bacterium]
MIGNGFPIDNEELETPYSLKEVTLTCTIEEIDKLIEFLSYVKEKHKKSMEVSTYTHSHYRDWDKNWTTDHTDFIISTAKKVGESTGSVWTYGGV